MTWHHQGQPVIEPPEGYVGFVYLIENLISGRKYIGKKLFSFAKTRTQTVKLKNGTKKKRRIKARIPSDWQDYYGSSKELLTDVEQLGKENFQRQILHYCKTKAECSYIEAKLQFEHRVLESKDWYNNNIQVRVHGSHIIKS